LAQPTPSLYAALNTLSYDATMKILIVFFLLFGVLTCASITGRGLWNHESATTIVGGNAALAVLLVLGFVHAVKKGRFLGFDQWLWLAITAGAYVTGVICNLTILSR
jgi:hypothetical protein